MTPLTGFAGWVDRLLMWRFRGRAGGAIRADLREEMERRAARSGAGAARRWFVWQAASVVAFSVFDRARGREWVARSPLGRGGRGSGGGGWELDPRDPLRILRRAPGYALAVVGTLGLAMAATLSVLTVVDRVLIADLPWPEAERIVRIDRLDDDGVPGDGGISFPDFQDWRAGAGSFEGLAAWQRFEGVFVRDGIAERWRGVAATADFLPLVGVRPVVGAVPTESEWTIGRNVAVLSHGLWVRRFGADPGIVGRTITVSEASWDVLAVMPQGFSFPESGVDLWVPVRDASFLENRQAGFVRVVGRVEAGVPIPVAREELLALADRIDAEYGSERAGYAFRTWGDVLLSPVRSMLWVFLGAVGFFLLAASVNVAGLTLSRLEARRREFSVRRALGATAGRLRRQLVLESAALGLAGGVVGAVGAWWGVRLLLWMAPPGLPRREEVDLGLGIVLAGLAISVACGIAAGLIGTLRRAAPMSVDTRRARRGESRVHGWMAGAQVALSVVLLFGSGLLLRSFDRLTSVETGIVDPESVMTMEIGLGRDRWGDDARVLEFHERLLTQVQEMPGVEAAATSTHLPFSGARLEAATLVGEQPFTRGTTPNVRIEVVHGPYFRTMGLALEGREPSQGAEMREVVLNGAAADVLDLPARWADSEVSFYAEEGLAAPPEFRYDVVGSVASVLDDGLAADPAPRGYYPLVGFLDRWDFVSGRFFYLAVRTRDDPARVLPAVQRIVADLDPNVPVQNAMTLERRMLDTVLTERFQALVISFFAVLAIAVALIGVHGVIAFGVRRGMRDVGVRLALGSGRGDVRRRVLARAAGVAAAGAAAGLVGALALGSLLDRFLFEVGSRDPATVLTVLAVALAGSLLAAVPPAVRAGRVDPVEVLRED